MTNVLPVNDALTTAQLETEIGELNFRAKRQVPAIGTPEYPTGWDLAHVGINAVLTKWERSR